MIVCNLLKQKAKVKPEWSQLCLRTELPGAKQHSYLKPVIIVSLFD
jgi:hypothetical protein